jgi:hypothetical protein
MDIACPCGSNVTIICAGTGPHAAALRCRNCNRHRQWLSHEDYRICGTALAEITGRFGEPVEISYRTIKQKRTEAMATEYDNTNRGALFKNTEKEDSKHADYRGEINVNGEEFWLNAWLKTSKKGAKYLSLSLKPKQAAAFDEKPKSAVGDDIGDEIPF